MRTVTLTYTLLFFLLSLSITAQEKGPPHKDLIKPITNGMVIHMEKGAKYHINISPLKINKKIYPYGYFNQSDPVLGLVIKKYPLVLKKTILVLEKDGKTYPLNNLRDTFKGETGEYKLFFNVNTQRSSIEAKGTIFVLTKHLHINRNLFNKVARGNLIRKSGNIFVDEDGMEWILQSDLKNALHDPAKNSKFLHPLPEGGEYETIRELCPDEFKYKVNIKGLHRKKITSDILKGCNVITYPYGGTYNFGKTSSALLHYFLDIEPHRNKEWGEKYVTHDASYPCGCKDNKSTTLFLFDRSGSMANKGISGKAKIEEAKDAAIHSLQSLQNTSGIQQEAGFLTFSGGCNNDPTASQLLTFSSDKQQLESAIRTIPRPGGGTPLKEAVDAATRRLQEYAIASGTTATPKLIIMSDGVSSCGKIRPLSVYGTGIPAPPGNASRFARNFTGTGPTANTTTNLSKNSEAPTPIAVAVTYYTIGFDIKPGSEAERDLQYLAQSSGGRYLNAQNAYELTRAFQRFFRLYRPKETPTLTDMDTESLQKFREGVFHIKEEKYTRAKEVFKTLADRFPEDPNTLFNLALMYEAHDYYSAAIALFEKYLDLHPEAEDKEWVLAYIQLLIKDREIFLEYTKNILRSDLAYLDLYFKKVQNGESLQLAEEFKGFIQEKHSYYENLPDVLGITQKQLRTGIHEIARGLKNCAKLIKKDPDNWDKNASPLLSMAYLHLERVLKSF
ncbi:VWA domain-containing protein [Ascidiimonas aurantiaca]|uniref:VWA domain-containing protein n=1 Tax=Ascidiimonas aurantiaca TaxID=1685432 RepID=UPI0030EDDBEE